MFPEDVKADLPSHSGSASAQTLAHGGFPYECVLCVYTSWKYAVSTHASDKVPQCPGQIREISGGIVSSALIALLTRALLISGGSRVHGGGPTSVLAGGPTLRGWGMG